MFQTFGIVFSIGTGGSFLLRRRGLLLPLFERLFHVLDGFDRLALGIDGHLRAALTGRFHLGALPFGAVGIPFEEVHLAQCEIGLDPCVERFALTVLDHALDVDALTSARLEGSLTASDLCL